MALSVAAFLGLLAAVACLRGVELVIYAASAPATRTRVPRHTTVLSLDGVAARRRAGRGRARGRVAEAAVHPGACRRHDADRRDCQRDAMVGDSHARRHWNVEVMDSVRSALWPTVVSTRAASELHGVFVELAAFHSFIRMADGARGSSLTSGCFRTGLLSKTRCCSAVPSTGQPWDTSHGLCHAAHGASGVAKLSYCSVTTTASGDRLELNRSQSSNAPRRTEWSLRSRYRQWVGRAAERRSGARVRLTRID